MSFFRKLNNFTGLTFFGSKNILYFKSEWIIKDLAFMLARPRPLGLKHVPMNTFCKLMRLHDFDVNQTTRAKLFYWETDTDPYFVTLAHACTVYSFTTSEASTALLVKTSTMSKVVAELLSFELLQREAKGYRITDKGRAIGQACLDKHNWLAGRDTDFPSRYLKW